MNDKYAKLRGWLEITQIKDIKWVAAAIDDMVDELECGKSLLKLLKERHAQLCTAGDLNLTHLSARLSVQCDGKTISINCLKSSFNDAQKVELKLMGFKWNKNKLDYVRPCKGAKVESVREFINNYEPVVTTN